MLAKTATPLIVILAMNFSVVLADPPATTSAPSTAAGLKDVSPCIAAIRQAGDASSAIAAYSRGCTIDRDSIELHEAYMRRMLQLGQPATAFYAAQSLVVLQPSNNLAWGVMGYNEGKRRRYFEALVDTMRALEALKDDPSILNNAGQLIAWHDFFGKSVAIPDPAKKTMEKLREELSAQDVFAKAYDRIKADYDKEQDRKDEVNKKIKDAEAAIKDADDQVKTMIDNLKKMEETARGKTVWELEQNNAPRKDIEQAQKDRDQAKADLPSARAKCQSVVADGQKKVALIADLKKQLSKTVDLSFRWDPPAVDGVVTPEAVGPRSATTAPSQPTLPEDAEAKAAQRLTLAKNYLSNKMNDKAVVILDEILKDYGKTSAAKEATELLKSIPHGD